MVVAAALLTLQTLWHGHLTGVVEYDDGVYFAASDALVHGVLPYRDYAFIQPPFIAVLLAPFALAARLIGSAAAFEAARVGIALTGLVNVGLVGRLLRGRPAGEVFAGMLVMAVYPGALSSAQTVLIEPLLVLLVLLAALALFSAGQITLSARRQWLAGAVLGVAVATKIWALAPLAVAVAVLWWAGRRQPGVAGGWWRLSVAAVLGVLACCAPFAVTALPDFLREIIVVQGIRPAGGFARPERLADLSGTAGLVHTLAAGGSSQAIAEIVIAVAFAAIAVQVATSWRRCRPVTDLERFAATSAVAVSVALLLAPTYYYHYSGFVAPFLALAVPRVIAALGAAAVTRRSVTASGGAAVRARLALPTVLLGLLVAAVAIADVSTTLRSPRPAQVTAAFDGAMDSGGCVLSLQPSLTILAGRNTTHRRGCSPVIDYQGAERVYAGGLSQDPADARNPTLQRQIQHWLDGADLIVVASASPSWGPAATRYVAEHFTRIDLPEQRVVVYRRDR